MWKESHFRREDEEFRPHRPRVGKKSLPVVTLDEPQDEIIEIQQLAGGSRATRKDEPEVLVCGPSQPRDGITFLSSVKTVNLHQPAPLSPVKAEGSDTEEIEGGSLGSPSYSPPRIPDEAEFGDPYTVKNDLWKTNGHPNQAGSISWHSRMPISILGWMKILPRTDSYPAQAGFFL